jgi:cell division protease FtsH
MAWRIDQEISALIRKAEQQSDELLSANRSRLDLLAEALMEEETLDGARVDNIIGRV